MLFFLPLIYFLLSDSTVPLKQLTQEKNKVNGLGITFFINFFNLVIMSGVLIITCQMQNN